jgi:hypothetical protein
VQASAPSPTLFKAEKVSKSEKKGSRWMAKKPISKFRKHLNNVPDHYLPRFIELIGEVIAPRCEPDQQLSRFLKFNEAPDEGRQFALCFPVLFVKPSPGKIIQMGQTRADAPRKLAVITTSSAKVSRARAELLSSDGLLASAVQAAHNGHYVVNLDNWGPELGGRLPQRKCSLGSLCENHAARTSKACVCQPTIALCPKHCFALHCVSLGVAQTPEDAAHVAAAAVQALPPVRPAIKLVL